MIFGPPAWDLWHRGINSDPQFRKSFCDMCNAAGVDPLSSSKGLWDELLGVGQFYNDLAVQAWKGIKAP